MNQSTDNPTLIIAAMHCELIATIKTLGLSKCQGFYDGRFNSQPIIAGVVGIGGKLASQNARQLIDQHHPRSIILIGFAGGLDPALVIADIIIPQYVINEQGQTLAISHDGIVAEIEAVNYQNVTLLSSDQGICKGSRKEALFEQYGAVAVDMETFAIAKLAADLQIPLQVRRAISDTADQDLPAEVFGWTSQDGQTLPMRVMTDLLCHPQLIGVVRRLAGAGKLSSQALAEAVVGVLG